MQKRGKANVKDLIFVGFVLQCAVRLVESSRGEAEPWTGQPNRIQTVSTAEAVQPFHWCVETCAGHVCVPLRSLHNQKDRQRHEQPGQHKQNSPLISAERAGSSFSKPVCSEGPRALDPLASTLSDLQIILSHLVMVQAP